MIKLLVRIFIRNYRSTENPDVRSQYGILCGIAGIVLNLLLSAAKAAAGIISGSVSVIADAFNNLTDAAASVTTLVGFKMSSKEPDQDHPFGHGRLEYISGLIVAFIILLVSFQLFKSSVSSVLKPEPVTATWFTVIILAVSILTKFYMYSYNHHFGKVINSASMEAVAKDSLGDTAATAAVLAVILVTKFFPSIKIPLDGIAGIFVAVFILINGIQAVKETVDPLLGYRADPEFVKKIEELVLSFKPISGIHDLVIHDYGPGRLMISLHAEVPGDKDIFLLHEVIDNAESAVAREFGCSATIHMDPVDTKNKEIPLLQEYIRTELHKIDSNITIHDLRVVPGAGHTNVVFDIVRPAGCMLSEAQLKNAAFTIIQNYKKNYFAVANIDNPYV